MQAETFERAYKYQNIVCLPMCVCVHDMPEVEMPFNRVGSRGNIMAIGLEDKIKTV